MWDAKENCWLFQESGSRQQPDAWCLCRCQGVEEHREERGEYVGCPGELLALSGVRQSHRHFGRIGKYAITVPVIMCPLQGH